MQTIVHTFEEENRITFNPIDTICKVDQSKWKAGDEDKIEKKVANP